MVFIGGGMGMAHAREEDTYPRLATPLGWATPDQVVDAVEAIVTTQRDFGNREDRHRARLKYLVDERGTEWFRAEVERRLGYRLGDPVELPAWIADEHHGTRDGIVGVPVPSGKVVDRGDVPAAHRPARADRGRHGHRGPGHGPPGPAAVRHRAEHGWARSSSACATTACASPAT